MKKLLSTILALGVILSTFTACESTQQEGTTKTPVTKFTTEGKTNELIPDETMTGELVVADYIHKSAIPYYNIAVEMYNELYPNVDVILDLTTYEEMDGKNHADKLATEVMSGKGPDIFTLGGENQDAYKMMKSGVLADLTEYFENDKTFDVSKYNETVLYGGQFQGKQYIVPTGYTFDGFFSTKEIMDEIGFEISKCNDYYTTMEEFFRVSDENVLDAEHQIYPGWNLMNSPQIFGGLNTFDYINNTVDINNDTIKANLEITKKTYDLLDTEQIKEYDSQFLISKQMLFSYQKVITLSDIGYWGENICIDDEVAFIPMRNSNGGITAESWGLRSVNANCDNIQNAYNFLKLLVHPDFMNKIHDGNIFHNGIPLNYEAIQNNFDTSFGIYMVSNENTDKLIEDFFETIRQIDELDIYMKPKDIFLWEIMPQYFNDEKTLDECLEEAQSKLEIYISE